MHSTSSLDFMYLTNLPVLVNYLSYIHPETTQESSIRRKETFPFVFLTEWIPNNSLVSVTHYILPIFVFFCVFHPLYFRHCEFICILEFNTLGPQIYEETTSDLYLLTKNSYCYVFTLKPWETWILEGDRASF